MYFTATRWVLEALVFSLFFLLIGSFLVGPCCLSRVKDMKLLFLVVPLQIRVHPFCSVYARNIFSAEQRLLRFLVV
jgi:hypothetical protein